MISPGRLVLGRTNFSLQFIDLIGELLFDHGSHDLTTEESDIKTSIAALNFIKSSAAKYNVDSESLSHELTTVGIA